MTCIVIFFRLDFIWMLIIVLYVSAKQSKWLSHHITSCFPRPLWKIIIFVVPSFRTHTYNNCYNLEGTEDIDDQTFLRRHQRHENDEKKRKRYVVWAMKMSAPIICQNRCIIAILMCRLIMLGNPKMFKVAWIRSFLLWCLFHATGEQHNFSVIITNS